MQLQNGIYLNYTEFKTTDGVQRTIAKKVLLFMISCILERKYEGIVDNLKSWSFLSKDELFDLFNPTRFPCCFSECLAQVSQIQFHAQRHLYKSSECVRKWLHGEWLFFNGFIQQKQPLGHGVQLNLYRG